MVDSESATKSSRPLVDLPRRHLAFLPTPLIELPRLSRFLGGPDILMKRDDQTGLALGGNKTRKLEYLIADALKQGCDTVITAGAAQSNHCRQTAAAAAREELQCHLLLGGVPPEVPDGNLLLNELFGAKIYWTGKERKGESLPNIVRVLKLEGRRPYVIPYGGSNEIGAYGYVNAMIEIYNQLEEQNRVADAIVFASSSGGTQAGLVVGADLVGYRGDIIGIRIDKEEIKGTSYRRILRNIANRTSSLAGSESLYIEDDFHVCEDYLGKGYGVVGPMEQEAIALVARLEGILLDPVYTGRAMGGLIERVRTGKHAKGETIVFIHTGGTPSLFPYRNQLNGFVSSLIE